MIKNLSFFMSYAMGVIVLTLYSCHEERAVLVKYLSHYRFSLFLPVVVPTSIIFFYAFIYF